MAAGKHVSAFECLLIVLAITVVGASIVLSLCIALVLQHHCKDCYNTLLCHYPNTTNTKTSYYTDEHKHSVQESSLDLKYLAAIIIPATVDYQEDKLFACNGIILSRFWVLTGEYCVQNEEEWFDLEIRTGSYLWDFGGQVNKINVVAKSFLTGPVALKTITPIEFNLYVQPVTIRPDFDHEEFCAINAGWYFNNNRLDCSFTTESWSPTDNINLTQGEIVSFGKCEKGLSGKGLIKSDGQLIALTCKNNNTKFMQMETYELGAWLAKLTGDLAVERGVGKQTTILNLLMNKTDSCKIDYEDFTNTAETATQQYNSTESAQNFTLVFNRTMIFNMTIRPGKAQDQYASSNEMTKAATYFQPTDISIFKNSQTELITPNILSTPATIDETTSNSSNFIQNRVGFANVTYSSYPATDNRPLKIPLFYPPQSNKRTKILEDEETANTFEGFWVPEED